MSFQRGSGFIGLQQYLNANRQQAEEMGNRVAAGVEQAGAAAQGAIDQRRAEVEGQIAQGVPQGPGSTYGLEPDEVAAMRANGIAGANYTGPQDMGNVDALSEQAGKAQQQARLAGTDAGRATLLRQGAGPAPYSTGQSMLDSFLVGRGAGQRLDAAASRFGDLQKYLGTAQEGVAASAKGAQDRAKAVRAQYEAIGVPTYAAPAAPAQQPYPGQPYVDNAKRVEDENAWKARHGIRG